MNQSDPWRYACPEGHRCIRTRSRPTQADARFYCRGCKEPYDTLIDLKRGVEVK